MLNCLQQRRETMAISKDKERVTAIISKDIEKKIVELAEKEKRTISAMTAILIEKGIDTYKQ
jgi:hypothetical protein